MTPNTKIFTDLLRESRAFLTVSAAEYGAGHNAAEVFRILPDSRLGVLVCHCETVSCAGGLLHLYGGDSFSPATQKTTSRFLSCFSSVTLETAAFSPSPASILRLQSAARCCFFPRAR